MTTSISFKTLLFNTNGVPDEIHEKKKPYSIQFISAFITDSGCLLKWYFNHVPKFESEDHIVRLNQDDYYQFRLLEASLSPQELMEYFLGDHSGKNILLPN